MADNLIDRVGENRPGGAQPILHVVQARRIPTRIGWVKAHQGGGQNRQPQQHRQSRQLGKPRANTVSEMAKVFF